LAGFVPKIGQKFTITITSNRSGRGVIGKVLHGAEFLRAGGNHCGGIQQMGKSGEPQELSQAFRRSAAGEADEEPAASSRLGWKAPCRKS
jgi:hypothetical protein